MALTGIIGETFESFVGDQIEVRQKILGRNYRSDNDLKYINASAPYLRLTSGINVDDSKLTELFGSGYNTGYLNNGLAKQFQLFGGTPTGGVGYSTANSYGYLSNSTYGYSPLPGILSAEVKSLTRGSLREAYVKIICHNLEQFKVIETLYLRLKYSMLLEWGHSMYYDNSFEFISNPTIDLSQDFLKGSIDKSKIDLNNEGLSGEVHLTQLAMQARVKTLRKESCGNYDAFFGLVKNFSWNVRTDGGYDIDLTLISTGDVIESLKINTLHPSAETALNLPEDGTVWPTSFTNQNKTTLNKILYGLRQQMTGQRSLWGYEAGGSIKNFCNSEALKWVGGGLTNNYHKDNPLSTIPTDFGTFHEFSKWAFPNLTPERYWYVEDFHYIKLGTLLKIIEGFLVVYDTDNALVAGTLPYSVDEGVGFPPIINIDYNFNENLCFTTPRQCSTDPRICIIPLDPNGGGTATDSYRYNRWELTGGTPAYYTTVSNTTTFGGGGGGSVTTTVEETVTIPFPTTPTTTNIVTTPPPATINAHGAYGANPLIFKNTSTYGAGFSDIDLEFSPTRLGTAPVQLGYYYVTSVANDQVLSTNRSGGETTENKKADIIIEQWIRETNVGVPPMFFDPNAARTYDFFNEIFGFRISGYPFLGKIMHIPINIEFIADTLQNHVDLKTGKLALYDFLRTILDGVQNATGNINSFEIIFDELTNNVRIIDNTLLPKEFSFRNYTPPKIVPINANLLRPNYGSFARNVTLKTEFSNAFATMVSIGAQANGNVPGEDATAFSRWNGGLTDRIIPKKAYSTGSGAGPTAEALYAGQLNSLRDFNAKVHYTTVNTEEVEAMRGALTDIIKYEIGTYSGNEIPNGLGFIPLNMSVTLDGISGPKIYQVYTIDETILPKNYKDKIQFITKGISHKISPEGWFTILESIGGPRNPDLEVKNPPGVAAFNAGGAPPGGGGGGGGGGEVPTPGPWTSTGVPAGIETVSCFWWSFKGETVGVDNQPDNTQTYNVPWWPLYDPGHKHSATPIEVHRAYRDSVHLGVDISAPTNTPVVSPANGKVVVYSHKPNGGAGPNHIVIEDSTTGLRHRLLHLNFVEPAIIEAYRNGTEITAGTKVGGVGQSIFSSGPHLHWEILVPGNRDDGWNRRNQHLSVPYYVLNSPAPPNCNQTANGDICELTFGGSCTLEEETSTDNKAYYITA